MNACMHSFMHYHLLLLPVRGRRRAGPLLAVGAPRGARVGHLHQLALRRRCSKEKECRVRNKDLLPLCLDKRRAQIQHISNMGWGVTKE